MKQINKLETYEGQGATLFVQIVNQLRQQIANEQIAHLDHCKENAFNELRQTEESITKIIETQRGGIKGAHGFIGECAQVGISNARDLLDGNIPKYVLVDDNGMVDYWRGSVPIQQKACISDSALGLTHIKAHHETYSAFCGVYQIPRDFYREYKKLCEMSASDAGKLLKAERRLWKRIQLFRKEFPDVIIEPMVVDYSDIQVNTIDQTLNRERIELDRLYRKRREVALKSGKASLQEGIKAAACSAVIEGILDGGLSVVNHMESDKAIRDFDRKDLEEIGVDTLKGAAKGAVRGGAIYAMTNCLGISAPVSGAVVSISFATVDAVNKCENGVITEKDCIKSISNSCLQSAVYVAFAKAGENLISNSIAGSFAGGIIGNSLYNLFIAICQRRSNNAVVTSE